ncbi:hypothetical protein HDV06_000789 [Boothiomyces sp. JEL0866]|nr:hypothetical protein HDV06_000789 [Boothiomyces sp. JEL0866]
MIDQLPAELLEGKIVFYIRLKDLYNLSQTNRYAYERLKAVRILAKLTKLNAQGSDIWPDLDLGDFINQTGLASAQSVNLNYDMTTTNVTTMKRPWGEEYRTILTELKKLNWRFRNISLRSRLYFEILDCLPKSKKLSLVYFDSEPDDPRLNDLLLKNRITSINHSGLALTRRSTRDLQTIFTNLKYMSKLKHLDLRVRGNENDSLVNLLVENLSLSQITSLSILGTMKSIIPCLSFTKITKLFMFLNEEDVKVLSDTLCETQIDSLGLLIHSSKDTMKFLSNALVNSKVTWLRLQHSESDMTFFFSLLPKMKLGCLQYFGILDYKSTMELIVGLPKSMLTEIKLCSISESLFPKLLQSFYESKIKKWTVSSMDHGFFCRVVSENIRYVRTRKLRPPYSTSSSNFANLIAKLPECDVEELDAQYNNFDQQAMEALEIALPKTKITRLNLMRSFQGNKQLTILSRSLKNSRVKELSIEWYRSIDYHRDIDEISVPVMVDFIKSNADQLNYLCINIREYDPNVDLLLKLDKQYENLTIDLDFHSYK